MKIKVKDKEYSFDGYVNPINSVQKLAEEMYQQGRADAIEQVINKCSKEYQVWSDDSVCKIWLSDLEKLKEQKE